jgi:hypothetical protein
MLAATDPVSLRNPASISLSMGPWCHKRDPAARFKILANTQEASYQHSDLSEIEHSESQIFRLQRSNLVSLLASDS